MLTLQLIEKYILLNDGFYLWKNTDSEYLGISNKFSRLLGCKSPNQMVGIRDENLPWAKFAEDAVANDQTALLQGNHQGVEYACFNHKPNEEISFLVNKHPFSDSSGNTAGIFANAIPLTKISLPTQTVRNLTKREQQCLYWTLRGKSCRMIGELLCLSKRTTEKHLRSLKLKFNVANKAALINQAISEGYLDMDTPIL